MLYDERKTWLISIGDGGNGKNDDINIMKGDCQNHQPGNGCCQSTYNYKGIPNALCGGRNFAIERFFVLQMK